MQISRKECEKIKMAINFDHDFSGWATKANVKCFDGLTIIMLIPGETTSIIAKGYGTVSLQAIGGWL